MPATHQSLVNHTLVGRSLYAISTHDRRVQFAAIGTDFFVAEVFNYISSGATLVFQPPGLSGSIHDFLRFLRENRITVTAVPGSYWSQWVYALSEGALALPESLRLVSDHRDGAHRSASVLDLESQDWREHPVVQCLRPIRDNLHILRVC